MRSAEYSLFHWQAATSEEWISSFIFLLLTWKEPILAGCRPGENRGSQPAAVYLNAIAFYSHADVKTGNKFLVSAAVNILWFQCKFRQLLTTPRDSEKQVPKERNSVHGIHAIALFDSLISQSGWVTQFGCSFFLLKWWSCILSHCCPGTWGWRCPTDGHTCCALRAACSNNAF